MMHANTREFSNDRPLSSATENRLDRAPFAERVAGVLGGLPKGTGLVVGIHGPWGDGKTSVLNMIRSSLDTDEQTATVEFNPWRFADESTMLEGFFQVLAGVVRAKLTTRVEDIAGMIERVGRLASVVNERAGRVGEAAANTAEVSLEELRSRLSLALEDAGKRIVVLVDDIDRLDIDETYTLFRIIKACADFPNVCYVLAFDDVAVSKSLGKRFGAGDEASGRAFLEKIIQVPLKLPVAVRQDLRWLCLEHVDRAINASGVVFAREDANRFALEFDIGLVMGLDTPRAAKRYGNSLMFALPMLKGEVDVVDLMLIEGIRVFYPSIYETIRENHSLLSGVEMTNALGKDEGSPAISLLKPKVDDLGTAETKAIWPLLQRLFPRLGPANGLGAYGSDSLPGWAKGKRICSPDYCARYFTYSVHKQDVRESEIEALYSRAANGSGADVQDLILKLFTSGKAKRLIARIGEGYERVAPLAVPSLCVAIAANAKYIPYHPAEFVPLRLTTQTARVIANLIKRLPAGEARVEVAKQVIQIADPLWFGRQVLHLLRIGDYGDQMGRGALTPEEVKMVRKLLVERIKARSGEGHWLFGVDVNEEQFLLDEWREEEGREPVQSHLQSVFARSNESIGQFLRAMAPQTWGLDHVVPREGDLDSGQLDHIQKLCDLDVLAEMVRRHLPGDFVNPEWTPDQRKPVLQRLAEQFMFVYKKSKMEGPTLGEQVNRE